MAEGNNPEQSKLPEKSGVFPLTKESVDNTLKKIGEGPKWELLEEMGIIEKDNQYLRLFLISTSQALSDDQSTYQEGGLWTYKFLREQAKLRGVNLPKMDRDMGFVHIQDERELSKSKGSGRHFLERKKQLEEREPELGRALKEISRYRINSEDFYTGALQTYLIMKKTIDSQELGNKLDM